MSLALQILIALVLGIGAGLLLQDHTDIAEGYIKPIGTIFLNLLKFIVVPIVLFSIMAGIVSMRDIKKVGSIGVKTVIYYLFTTAFAIVIGLAGGFLFKNFFPVLETSELSYEASETAPFMDTIVNIFPSNFIAPLSIGTAGVPGAGMVMLAMVLSSVGLPLDGIALVAGVDRIFDMGRTVVNITGDASCAIVVSNLERKKAARKAAKKNAS